MENQRHKPTLESLELVADSALGAVAGSVSRCKRAGVEKVSPCVRGDLKYLISEGPKSPNGIVWQSDMIGTSALFELAHKINRELEIHSRNDED